MLFAKAEFNGFEELDKVTTSKEYKTLHLHLRERGVDFDWFIDNTPKPLEKIGIKTVTFGFFQGPPFFMRRSSMTREEIVEEFRQAGIKLEKFVEK